MRGLLTLDPDAATLTRLTALQNRLRDSITRQGVHFSDRLAPTLLAWPFATLDELDAAAALVHPSAPPSLVLGSLQGQPNNDRPAEIGLRLEGCEPLQASLADLLKQALDPDPPRPAFVRLARVAPPSRKVGAAFRASGLSIGEAIPFVPCSLSLWRQTPQGFELHRALPL